MNSRQILTPKLGKNSCRIYLKGFEKPQSYSVRTANKNSSALKKFYAYQLTKYFWIYMSHEGRAYWCSHWLKFYLNLGLSHPWSSSISLIFIFHSENFFLAALWADVQRWVRCLLTARPPHVWLSPTDKSTKTADTTAITSYTKRNNLGTYQKNFQVRYLEKVYKSIATLLQWNIIKCGDQDVARRKLV